MDRQTIYAGQIPLETDLLNTNKNTMVALAKLAAAMFGTATVVNGLACVPTAPAGLTVNVNPGEMYSLVATDATAYSSLSADSHNILKQGVVLDAVNLSCPAPGTAGQSINYLVQATYQDSDAGSVVLPYYNASNPSQAWSGPGNTGTAQPTARKGIVVLSAKAGVAATTGSQTTPAPDAGYTGLYVVTVANGQTTITAANIAQASNAPILPTDLLHAIQANSLITANDTGTANTYAVSFSPAITALTDGMVVWFKAKTANTGASTLNVNGLGASPMVGGAHSALQGGEIVVNGKCQAVWRADISSWVLIECTGGAIQVAAATQTQHAPQYGQLPQHGQCRLSLSGGNLLLAPYNGNKLIIGGVMRTIPAAGISLAPTGLTAATTYYVYAFMNGAAMTLEASTTGHSTDATTGVEVKTGDASRTLVGMAYPVTGPAFADNYQQRLVLSWFNRRNVLVAGNFTAGRSTTSSTPTELNSEIRNNFLCWGDEAINMNTYGIVTLAGSPGQQASTGIAVDSSSVLYDASIQYQRDTNSNIGTSTVGTSALLSEGFHFSTLLGYVSASNATWSTNNFLKSIIRG
ncbi:hypothetical protein CNECB9_2370085 [Cupriavidus necator]|uniref:Uncharacterized protein n=1 Tax=Cupriavidus necator TaxID=106590 RepID=A0A1K0JJX5_CUPNE|nr:hypothetical protein CNECB9_2370085 [Cupriavidus necator]